MKKLLFALLVILLTGCIGVSHIAQTSGLSELELKKIPQGAKEVILQKDVTVSELYEEIYSSLLLRGHRIAKDDKERHYIMTEGKDVGQSTLHRLTVLVTENEGKSTATIRTEWKPGTEAVMGASIATGVGISADWSQATWLADRSGLAFAESAAIANGVKDGKITFK